MDSNCSIDNIVIKNQAVMTKITNGKLNEIMNIQIFS